MTAHTMTHDEVHAIYGELLRVEAGQEPMPLDREDDPR